jgi:protein involved in polysaccharide export with SLBB domain
MWKRSGWIGLSGLLALVGCGDTRSSTPVAATTNIDGVFRRASAVGVSATEYRVAPPDKLIIRAPGVKELDQLVTTVRPDGMIQLNLIGEVAVAGQTPKEIGRMLTEAAGKYFNDVAVQADVVEYNSKFYAVFGTAVVNPGRKAYTGRDTVISAVAAAGFNEKSWPQHVRVSRPSHDDGAGAVVEIDMTRVYLAGDTRQNYLLNEGDIIWVPYSPLAEWDEKTRQLFGPLSAGAGTVGAVQGVGSH